VSAVKDSLDKKGKATGRTVKAVATLVEELAKGVRSAKSSAGRGNGKAKK
jgi:tryptophan synthase alpha chain